MSDPIKRVTANSALLIAARMIDAAAILLTSIIIARHLHPLHYGQYSFILAYVVAVSVISYFGLDALVVRDVARHEEEAAYYLGAIMFARWLLCLLAAVIIVAGIPFLRISKEFFPALAMLVASELTNAWVSVQTSVFRAYEKMIYETLIILSWRIVSLGAIILAVFLGAGLNGVCLALLTANLVRAAITWKVARSKFIRPDFSRVRQLLGSVFKDAIALGSAMLITNWLLRSAHVTIKLLSGEEPVAYFQVSHAMIQQAAMVGFSIALALFPAISRSAKGDAGGKERAEKIYSSVSRFLVCAGLALSSGLAFLSKPVILLLYGSSYVEAVPVFQTLLISMVPFFVFTLNIFVFAAYDKQHLAIISRGAGLALAVILYRTFIPSFGVLGASYAYAAAIVFIAVLEGAFLRLLVADGLKLPFGLFGLGVALAVALSFAISLGRWREALLLLLVVIFTLAYQSKFLLAALREYRTLNRVG